MSTVVSGIGVRGRGRGRIRSPTVVGETSAVGGRGRGRSFFEGGGFSGGRTSSRRRFFDALPQLPAYDDLGDPVYICQHCYACFWFDERVCSLSVGGRVVYRQCCRSGSVALPLPLRPPLRLLELYKNYRFMEDIRAYNMMFSMTSFGANVDTSVNAAHGPYIFKVSGQICHRLGTLCPEPGCPPRFLQLYLYDTDHEVQNRMQFYRSDGRDPLDVKIVALLIDLLNLTNEYVRTFKTATDLAAECHFEVYSVRLYQNVPDRRYDPPQPGTLGAIVSANDDNASRFDIVVHSKDGLPRRVSMLHPSYMPLQYPLLFPYGEDGWFKEMRLKMDDGSNGSSLTINMYYSSMLHERPGYLSLVLHAGRLFQQFLVDAYLCVEQGRLDYIRIHQNLLRSEFVSGVHDAVSRGDTEGRVIGKRVFLPSSFVGGPRYMYKHYQDALAICRVHGNPQYFITFTCNANWPEIRRYNDHFSIRHSENRPDTIARVFEMKVAQFISFMKEDKTFGRIVAYLYTIEFQKRGLPHCHTLIWVESASKIRVPSDVDRYISAELPDPQSEASLYRTITSCMIHGPCDSLSSTAVCMRDGKCKKGFPKPFNNTTMFDDDGYVHYKRSANAFHTLNSGVDIHNGFVVPYNKRLCSRFNAHINVEYCGWNMVIKYLFKYISKGVDRVRYDVQRTDTTTGISAAESVPVIDEVSNFVEGRYICPHEAAWRLLNFSIHERHPAVVILSVHLENLQNVTFRDNSRLEVIVNDPAFGNTTLTQWLSTNSKCLDGRNLTYIEFPTLYRWDASSKIWIRRSTRTTPAIGRLAYVHPTAGELFYLRLLLSHRKGCTSFTAIRTVGDTIFHTYQQACDALKLTGDDREWLTAFNDASCWASASELRLLFCNLLLYGEVTNAKLLWENAQSKMGDDILRNIRNNMPSTSFRPTADFVKEQILFELEKLLNGSTPSKSLSDFDLPLPSRSTYALLNNRLLIEETCYDTARLQAEHNRMVKILNSAQLNIYNNIREAILGGNQTLLFVYGYGGTGKTFLWATILAYFRSIGKVVLAVATSGIASLLLPSGRTAHSRFRIPLQLTETSMCAIKKKTQLSELLKLASFVIWDEATMTDKRCFECIDRTFRDILDKKDQPFGGMSMLLGGDFRQTLPIKPKKSPADIIASTLPHSYLWHYFRLYRLTENMRLCSQGNESVGTEERSLFASWLIQIGNGEAGKPDPTDPENIQIVDIPRHLLIDTSDPKYQLQKLISFVYDPDILENPSPTALANRAIVSPKNITVDQINNLVLEMTAGLSYTFLSTDSIIPHSHPKCDLDLRYPQEYLHELTFPGLPLHKLTVKKNTPIILLRNLNQSLGLCNGTRMIVSRATNSILEAVIVTGTFMGKKVLIPRIKFVHESEDLPFVFTRKQFPVKVCYAMTINKSQGQSLQKIGVYLPEPVFGHGQLYVALSRATSPTSVKVLVLDKNGQATNTTNNVVFKTLLTHISNEERRYAGESSQS